jgi:hypothetical protein
MILLLTIIVKNQENDEDFISKNKKLQDFINLNLAYYITNLLNQLNFNNY